MLLLNRKHQLSILNKKLHNFYKNICESYKNYWCKIIDSTYYNIKVDVMIIWFFTYILKLKLSIFFDCNINELYIVNYKSEKITSHITIQYRYVSVWVRCYEIIKCLIPTDK